MATVVEKHVYCDRCGKELEHDCDIDELVKTDYNMLGEPIETKYQFCWPCFGKFEKWVKEGNNTANITNHSH